MFASKQTIGRISRPHLEVEKIENGGVKLAVLEGGEPALVGDALVSVLVGYAFVGPSDDGYTIHSIESWAGSENTVNIKQTVHNCLSIKRFKKLVA